MRNGIKAAGYGAALAMALAVSGSANAATLTFLSGNVNSGLFGDTGVAAGTFTDTLAFNLASAGLFSASLTSPATRVGQAGDIDFSSVVLTGAGGPYNFSIVNNGGADGLTDSSTFSRSLIAGSYLLTISGRSYGNAQFAGNTTVETRATTPVPEAGTWLMMVAGFGLMGAITRRQRAVVTFA